MWPLADTLEVCMQLVVRALCVWCGAAAVLRGLVDSLIALLCMRHVCRCDFVVGRPPVV